jgi:pantoate--beta-alanine ligase
MLIISEIQSLRMQLGAWRRAGQRIALVPTMGNLHAGHLSLIEHARSQADRTVVSIFVNPMQFDRAEDLDAYPRTPEDDFQLLQAADVDLVFAPAVEAIYPRGMASNTRVEVPHLSSILEGASRPGHFVGVATIVAKLFNLVQPDVAIFGEKDFQQLLVIRRMVADLQLPIEVIGLPTMREPGGLAMSSRNQRLTSEERTQAPGLYATLLRVCERLRDGERDFESLEAQALQELRTRGFRPDYVSVRRVEDLAAPVGDDQDLVVLAAAWLGRTRLIDNIRQPLMGDR